jgi:hypothetical protein
MLQVTNYICCSKSSFSSLTGTLHDIAFSAALVRLGSGEPEENTFMAEAKLLQPWIKIIVISGTRTSMPFETEHIDLSWIWHHSLLDRPVPFANATEPSRSVARPSYPAGDGRGNRKVCGTWTGCFCMACGRPGNRELAQSGAGASSPSKRVDIPSMKPEVPRFVAFFGESHNFFINSHTFASEQSHFYFIRLRQRPSHEKMTEYGKVTSTRLLPTRQSIF